MQEIDNAQEYMSYKKSLHKSRATYLKLGAILLSGSGTVLLGLQISGFEKLFKDLAFVFIALVTLVNALEPFFNFRSLWVAHEEAQAGFYKVKQDLEFYLAGISPNELSSEVIENLYSKYQNVWEAHNQAWLGYRKQEMAINSYTSQNTY